MQTTEPYFSCTWVGGEPLLKQGLIEKARVYFRHNMLVTNGTLPLPNWTDVEFHVSLDGTEQIHDEIRGHGCYAKIKENLSKPYCTNLKIALACCLNKKNVHCLEPLLEEWFQVPAISHILFDFVTPVRGSDESLWLNLKERDEVLNHLKILKKEYGDFIGVPAGMFNLMHSSKAYKYVGKNCVCVKNGAAFDAWGNRKKPCVMGPQADCAKCGCIVPFSIRAWKKPSNLLREIINEFRKH